MWSEKQLESDIGTADYFEQQKNVILSRPLIRHYYETWYQLLKNDFISVPNPEGKPCLELGSGGGFLKKSIPDVITSDVVPQAAETVVDGRSLPFEDQGLSALFLSHAFHHIPDVEKFLGEADRCLIPGGVISMIEVSHTPFSKFFFKNFHPEPYDDRATNWEFSSNHNFDANQALSWIVFVRDKKLFEKKFPNLVIESTRLLPWFGYMASGGVTRKNLIPTWSIPFFKLMDKLISPFDRLFALHWHLRIRKKYESH